MDTDPQGVPIRYNYVLTGFDTQPLTDKGVALTVGEVLIRAAEAPPVPGTTYMPSECMARYDFSGNMRKNMRTKTERNAAALVAPALLLSLSANIAAQWPVIVAGQMFKLLERWASPQQPPPDEQADQTL